MYPTALWLKFLVIHKHKIAPGCRVQGAFYSDWSIAPGCTCIWLVNSSGVHFILIGQFFCSFYYRLNSSEYHWFSMNFQANHTLSHLVNHLFDIDAVEIDSIYIDIQSFRSIFNRIQFISSSTTRLSSMDHPSLGPYKFFFHQQFSSIPNYIPQDYLSIQMGPFF